MYPIHARPESFVASTFCYMAEDAEYSEAHFHWPGSRRYYPPEYTYNSLIVQTEDLRPFAGGGVYGGGELARAQVQAWPCDELFRPAQ